MDENSIKQRTQAVIVSMSVLIMVGKFVAFYITNSAGILTDAMESIVNVTAGFLGLYSLWYSAKPKDKSHPFGHGKFEFISASIEAIMISTAGGIIIYEGIMRLYHPAKIENLDVGIIVVAVAGLMNYIMGWYSIKTGKKYNSMALIAGGKHLQSDTYSTIGLVLGLVILYFTDIVWIDSVLAMIFGAVILFTGFSILKKTGDDLMDKSDPLILEDILDVINDKDKPQWVDIHNMKVIKYGSRYFVDCDLTLPWYYSIKEGHQQSDDLRRIMSEKLDNKVTVSIHSDACKDHQCVNCAMSECPYRKHEFIEKPYLTIETITDSDEDRHED